MWCPLLLLIFVSIFISVDSRPLTASTEGTQIVKVITVSQSRRADFRKIQDAINAVPPYNKQWICIRVYSGVYKEKVKIPWEKPFIFLEGDGADTTIIKWNGHGQTDQSATFTSQADNFVAKGITFLNYYNVEKGVHRPIQPAVAAAIYGDKSAFFGCSFVGVQDTLFDVQGRHYFSNCIIEGAVDFIFGNGQSFYENCDYKVNVDLLPSYVAAGYITAQKRDSPRNRGGFVFYGGRVSGTGKVFLGRAWGLYSRVIFYKTNFNIDVVPQGWDAWGKPTRGLFYVEDECDGKGSDVRRRVKWARHNLSKNQMQPYTRAMFIQDDWLGTIPR